MKRINFDQPPIIVADRAVVPLRAVFEAFGATVDWNEETQKVISTKDDTTISMTIGNFQMYKNGEKFVLDVAPQIVGDSALVPVSALAQSFNINVDWNENTRTVLLSE